MELRFPYKSLHDVFIVVSKTVFTGEDNFKYLKDNSNCCTLERRTQNLPRGLLLSICYTVSRNKIMPKYNFISANQKITDFYEAPQYTTALSGSHSYQIFTQLIKTLTLIHSQP